MGLNKLAICEYKEFKMTIKWNENTILHENNNYDSVNKVSTKKVIYQGFFKTFFLLFITFVINKLILKVTSV